MKKLYYLYIHKRRDKDKVFYVGIGSGYKGDVRRAFDHRFNKRNNIWVKVYKKNKGRVEVKIIKKSYNLKKIQSLEIKLIKKYGRIVDNSGHLANIGLGGYDIRTNQICKNRRVIQNLQKRV